MNSHLIANMTLSDLVSSNGTLQDSCDLLLNWIEKNGDKKWKSKINYSCQHILSRISSHIQNSNSVTSVNREKEKKTKDSNGNEFEVHVAMCFMRILSTFSYDLGQLNAHVVAHTTGYDIECFTWLRTLYDVMKAKSNRKWKCLCKCALHEWIELRTGGKLCQKTTHTPII